jgi:large subunit ribosomal protein L19
VVESPSTMETKETPKIPDFRAGDTVKVFYKIKEGDKERIQPFEGIVIALKGNQTTGTFTVRKIAVAGIGVERIFPIKSPLIQKIELIQEGDVRRAKLYYIRDRIGKAASKVDARV